MLPEITTEELSHAMDSVAWGLLADSGTCGPPIDAFELARTLGITVARDDRQTGRARYVRLRGRRPTILLRSEPRDERQHWAVAHEIGEHAAHRVFGALGVDPREAPHGTREAVANCLAGRILLPAEWFTRDARECNWDLLALKVCYRTASHELIARRMLEFDSPVIISIFDHREVSFRRSNLPGRVPPPSSAELQCWRSVHDANRPDQTHDGTRLVHGWPVHEAGWKREILRTEVELFLQEA